MGAMPDISLSVVRDGDPPPWEDLAEGGRYIVGGASWKLAALERGMASGQPSVALRLDLPDGQVIICENSLAAWIAATSAMRGAFPAAFAGGPLEPPPPL